MTAAKANAFGRAVRAVALVLAASLSALAVAGCGGGDDYGSKKADRGAGPSTARSTPGPRAAAAAPPSAADARAIRKLLVTAFVTDDVDITCKRIFTQGLLEQLYDDETGCRKAAADDEDETDPDRVTVSAIEMHGRGATARVRLVGGDSEGTDGIVSLAEGGQGWRLDDLSIKFLRSAFTASLATEKKISHEVTRCINGRLRKMPDRDFKEFAYGSIGKKPEAQRRLVVVLSRCERAMGRASTVRREFQKGVAKSLRDAGARRQVVTCVTDRLRRGVSDETLIELSALKRARQRARVKGLVLAALSACGGGNGGDPPGEAA